MKSEVELCKIVPDLDGSIAKWVCDGLKENTDWIGANVTIGIFLGGNLIAGIIFNDHRKDIDVWLTIYSIDKRWCTKAVIKYVFGIVFKLMNCRRCNIFISKDNQKSLSLCERLGFKKEGLLRQYRENGTDCYILGMLKSECRWLS
jgi:RimJ/RimL family protein N-acetyltransferase